MNQLNFGQAFPIKGGAFFMSSLTFTVPTNGNCLFTKSSSKRSSQIIDTKPSPKRFKTKISVTIGPFTCLFSPHSASYSTSSIRSQTNSRKYLEIQKFLLKTF